MKAFLSTLLAVALGGCVSLTPNLDSRFGDAVNMAKAKQVRDKDAPVRNAGKDVAGIDGVAAREALARYQKSFRDPEPTSSVFVIGVGGAEGGGRR